MHPALLPWPKRWLYALKVASWPKLLAPMLLGQAIGGVTAGAWSPAATLLGLAHAVALTCAIVLLNDFADRQVDALKRRLFPEGCSAKTIPDGILGAQAVLLAAKITALFDGRFAPSIEDVQKNALPALRHRVLLNFEGEAEGKKTDEILKKILDKLPETAS